MLTVRVALFSEKALRISLFASPHFRFPLLFSTVLLSHLFFFKFNLISINYFNYFILKTRTKLRTKQRDQKMSCANCGHSFCSEYIGNCHCPGCEKAVSGDYKYDGFEYAQAVCYCGGQVYKPSTGDYYYYCCKCHAFRRKD